MIVYTVHEPPDAPVDRIDRAEALTFIGDRFSPVATALGPLWLLGNRLWLGFTLYAVAAAAGAFVILAAGLNPGWLSLMFSALNIMLGFEAASLRRWTLERRGWRTLGTVSGRNVDECERRFLETWLPEQRLSMASRMAAAAGPASGLAHAASGEPGGRLDARPRRSWLSWRGRRHGHG